MEKELLEQAQKLLTEKTNEKTLICNYVEKYNDNNDGHQKRILVVTEYRIALYKGKTKVEFSRERWWVDITKMIWNEDIKRLDLIFKNDPETKKPLQVRFTCDEVLKYRELIANYLTRILPPVQIEEAGIKQFVTQHKKAVAISAIKRLNAYTYSRDKTVDTTARNHFIGMVKYRFEKVKLPGSSTDKAFFVAAAQANPACEHLYLYDESEDVYSVIATIPSGYSPFKHITFDSPNAFKIESMFNSIKARNVALFHTDGFTFKDAQLEPAKVEKLAEMMNFKQFKALTFTNALKPESYEPFVNTFLTESVTSQLQYFGLEQCPNINVEEICAKVPNVVALSVAKNGLEIGQALKTISGANLQHLRAINLAGNKCDEDTPFGVPVPENIELIDISNCTFANGKLVNFLVYLFKTDFKKGITIVANNLQASNEELDKALDYISTVKKCPLIGLSWNGNNVSPSLANLVRVARHLRILFLDDCFDAQSESKVKPLAAAIEELPKFRKLSCRGVTKQAGAAIIPLIKALVKVETIEYLDVGNQAIGNEGLHAVSDILNAKRPLRFLDIDDSKPETYDAIQNIIDICQQNGEKIRISYPVHDIKPFLQNDKALEGKLIVYLNKFAEDEVEEYQADDEFTKPFDVYVHQPEIEIEFPQFESRNITSFFDAADEISEIEEIASPKKKRRDESESDSDEYEDDEKRVKKQTERALFYAGDGNTESEAPDSDSANKKAEQEKIDLWFKDDNLRLNPDWEDWHPEGSPDIFKEFDVGPTLQKIDKKYHLDVLREAIQ